MKYKILKADGPPNEAQLEALAEDGWELAALLSWGGDLFVCLVKRVAH